MNNLPKDIKTMNRKKINEVLQKIIDRHDTRDEFVFSKDTDDILELFDEYKLEVRDSVREIIRQEMITLSQTPIPMRMGTYSMLQLLDKRVKEKS